MRRSEEDTVKMSWEDFQKWQRWDEFPEQRYSPPMTADFAFWYRGKKYYCTGESHGFVLVDEKWARIAFDLNFCKLLEKPVFSRKSFRQCLGEIRIED